MPAPELDLSLSLGLGGAGLGNPQVALDDATTQAALSVAGLRGVRLFDTAPHYGLARWAAEIKHACGAERLMYGGDWPMATAENSYTAIPQAVDEPVAALSPDEQQHIWRETALRVYGREEG